MELRQNAHLIASRPMAWLTALFIALAVVLISWYAIQSGTPTHQYGAGTPRATSDASVRDGGPGGQFGDETPAPRVGGPGGQLGNGS